MAGSQDANKDEKKTWEYMLDKEKIQVRWKTPINMIPYGLLGLVVFSFNSSLDLPYMVRGYATIMEFQVGFLIIYFLLQKKGLSKKSNSK